MRLFTEPKIDFLGLRSWGAALSLILIAIGVVSVIAKGGPQLGIDFAGGSQIVVRFAEAPDLRGLRSVLAEEGLTDSVIQEFEGANEILIRTPQVGEAQEEEVVRQVDAALDRLDPPPEDAGARVDLNTVGEARLVDRLLQVNPLGYDLPVQQGQAESRYRQAAQSVLQVKAREGLISSWEEVEATGIAAEIVAAIRDFGYLGHHSVISTEWVGPQVGRDLRRQATQAIAWALLGMLAYISYRFEFRYGVGAVVALSHDVLITLGAFSLTNREFNLPVIAAFLTIVGYSLNDTVVVFDRIRENNQVLRRLSSLERMNASINQTLSRTVLTSGTTLLVVASLYLYGGQVINDFAFALLVGVVVGTYSSVFVASPFVYVWEQFARRRKSS